jgi:hypothetical protein
MDQKSSAIDTSTDKDAAGCCCRKQDIPSTSLEPKPPFKERFSSSVDAMIFSTSTKKNGHQDY